MNMSKVVGIVAIAGMVVLGIAWMGHEVRQQQHYANVISAKLVTTNVEGPRERCYEETVTRTTDEEQRTAGVFSKAVHALKRRTKTIATDASNEVTNTNAGPIYNEYIEQRCETLYDSEQQPAGYDVKYRYDGKAGVVHMDHNPGKHIPVENGELVLNDDSDDGTTPG